MPLDSEGHEPKTAEQKKRDRILIIVGVVGVLIAFFTLMALKKKATASGTTTTAVNQQTQTQAAWEAGVDTVLSTLLQHRGVGTGSTTVTTTKTKGTTTGHGSGTSPNTGANGQQGNQTTAPQPWSPAPETTTIKNQIAGTGGTLAGEIQGQGNSSIFLSSGGGVYIPPNTKAQGFFGSIYDLPASIQSGIRGTFNKIFTTPTGGYTLEDTTGQEYHFGPTANWASGTPTKAHNK